MKRIFNIVVLTLALPLKALVLVVHLKEEIRSSIGSLKNDLFIQRLDLIDDQHFQAFLSWNRKYKIDRVIKGKELQRLNKGS